MATNYNSHSRNYFRIKLESETVILYMITLEIIFYVVKTQKFLGITKFHFILLWSGAESHQ